MSLAIIRDGAAVELTPGADVPVILDTTPPDTGAAHYAAVMSWTEQARNAGGIYTVTDATITPGHKLGPMVVTVAGGVTTITRAAVALAGDELAANLADRKAALKDSVMGLRDARIGNGVAFGGHAFQTRPDDRENVQGAAQLAALWIMAGGDPASLRWHGGTSDFAWIDASNALRTMSAATVIDFGKAVAAMKSAAIFNAFAIKAAIDGASSHAALDAIDVNAGWPA